MWAIMPQFCASNPKLIAAGSVFITLIRFLFIALQLTQYELSVACFSTVLIKQTRSHLLVEWREPNWFPVYIWHDIVFLCPFPTVTCVDVVAAERDLWGTRRAAVSDCLLVYSISADGAAYYAWLPDSISRFSCHLGWAVNANKLISMVLQTRCCRLWGVLVHVHTTNKLLMWTNPCAVDSVQYKLNLLCLPVYKKNGAYVLCLIR